MSGKPALRGKSPRITALTPVAVNEQAVTIEGSSKLVSTKGPKRTGRRKARKWLRLATAIAGYGALLSLGFWGSEALVQALGLKPGDNALIVDDRRIWLGLAVYALLLAVPFVPGIEISLALLAIFGPAIVVQVYIATVVAFLLAFLIGKSVPSRLISSFFLSIGFTRASELFERLRPLSRKQRLALLVENAPSGWLPFLLRYRYIALALAFNLPGNAVLGGGGGIAMLTGLSGMFSFPAFLFVACVSALPLPLAWLVLGGLF